MIQNKIHKALSILVGFFEYNVTSQFVPLRPKSLMVVLTYRCNSRCKMCNIWKQKPQKEFAPADWKKLLHDRIFRDVSTLSITGGEPFLLPDFMETVSVFLSSLPKLRHVGIVTNGFCTDKVLQNTEKLLSLCREKNIYVSVSVSLDGVGEIHEKVRRVPGAFAHTTATISGLRVLQEKFRFSLNCGAVLMNQTLPHADRLRRWFDENSLSSTFQIVGFHPAYVDNMNLKRRVGFKKQDAGALISILEKFAAGKAFFDFRSYYWADMVNMYKNRKPRTTPCPFQKDHFAVDSRGGVFYCLSEKTIGNFPADGTVGGIYYRPDNLRFRRKITHTSCLTCNSGCDVETAIAKNAFKYLLFRITGKIL